MDCKLPDVQSLVDHRNIAINRVGVRGVTMPMTITSSAGTQSTVATANLFVSLPQSQRGTHMSRFVTLLDENKEPLSIPLMQRLLSKMLKMLESDAGTIEIVCPFFVRKASPVSGLESLMNYTVRFVADHSDGKTSIRQETTVPVTSLCPCSREISQYGAHNQRSQIVISVECGDVPLSLEEQIRIAETSASCELWSRLKRNDEKFVTEYAYDHPKFVEDTVRECSGKLNADSRIVAYRIEVENFESIHNHSAFAMVERDKRTH